MLTTQVGAAVLRATYAPAEKRGIPVYSIHELAEDPACRRPLHGNPPARLVRRPRASRPTTRTNSRPPGQSAQECHVQERQQRTRAEQNTQTHRAV